MSEEIEYVVTNRERLIPESELTAAYVRIAALEAQLAQAKDAAEKQLGDTGERLYYAGRDYAKMHAALQGMLDWYEDTYGAGFCECDKSVDLTCRACVARRLLPVKESGACS